MTAIVTATAIASMLDPTIMAHIALGEAGGWGIWGSDERAYKMQEMVIWVAKNQSVCSWAPEDYDPRTQFYAWDDNITEADVERARAVIDSQGPDPTGNMLHVISEQDRIRLGFPRGDIVECGVAPFCLNFYKEWSSPNKEGRELKVLADFLMANFENEVYRVDSNHAVGVAIHLLDELLKHRQRLRSIAGGWGAPDGRLTWEMPNREAE